jgi:hypothetical protein
MKQDLVDLHHKMLQEHLIIFNRLAKAKGRKGKTELGKRTFATSRGAPRWTFHLLIACTGFLINSAIAQPATLTLY